MDETIFVAIASYQDRLLARTITRAIETAHRPDLLRFGVVDQILSTDNSFSIPRLCSGNISYVHIHPNESRGACWARSLCMTFYANEDWFLQIDSHTDFEIGWDTYFKEQAHMLDLKNKPGVITGYPAAFNISPQGEVTYNRYSDIVLYNVLCQDQAFKNDYPGLMFVAELRSGTKPLKGFHVAGGCLFAPGSFVNKFPYDPWFYFIGEEQSMSLRLFTHGWDIYHTANNPLYHLYNTPGSGRSLHWDEEQDKTRGVRWYKLEENSKARFKRLCFGDGDLGIYGLGRVRTREDFARYCGIDYINKTIYTDSEVKHQ